MTNENQTKDIIESQQLFTDLGQSYGLLIGQLTLNKLGLERQAQRLQTEVAMIKAEITQLNQERANFISAHVNLEEQISDLQAENESLRKKLYQMETDLLKAQGKAIINEVQVTDGADAKEKATDEGGYVESPFNVTRTIRPG